MKDNIIELFLSQVESLNGIALSIIENLKLSSLQNDMLKNEKNKLEEELRLSRLEVIKLQNLLEKMTFNTKDNKEL